MPNNKYFETIKKFRLIDDTFFSACFDNNEADVEYILRIILDKPNLNVLKVQTQKILSCSIITVKKSFTLLPNFITHYALRITHCLVSVAGGR